MYGMGYGMNQGQMGGACCHPPVAPVAAYGVGHGVGVAVIAVAILILIALGLIF
jgi:hypothetical protein